MYTIQSGIKIITLREVQSIKKAQSGWDISIQLCHAQEYRIHNLTFRHSKVLKMQSYSINISVSYVYHS